MWENWWLSVFVMPLFGLNILKSSLIDIIFFLLQISLNCVGVSAIELEIYYSFPKTFCEVYLDPCGIWNSQEPYCCTHFELLVRNLIPAILQEKRIFKSVWLLDRLTSLFSMEKRSIGKISTSHKKRDASHSSNESLSSVGSMESASAVAKCFDDNTNRSEFKGKTKSIARSEESISSAGSTSAVDATKNAKGTHRECPHCKKILSSFHAVQTHLRVCEPFSLCGSRYTDLHLHYFCVIHLFTHWPFDQFQFHLFNSQIHDRAGEFHCAKCKFKTRIREELKAHDKIHRTCAFCGKTFTHLHKHKQSCLKSDNGWESHKILDRGYSWLCYWVESKVLLTYFHICLSCGWLKANPIVCKLLLLVSSKNHPSILYIFHWKYLWEVHHAILQNEMPFSLWLRLSVLWIYHVQQLWVFRVVIHPYPAILSFTHFLSGALPFFFWLASPWFPPISYDPSFNAI